MSNRLDAADILVNYSSLQNIQALKTSEVSINKIDWAKIETSVLSKQESILIEILRFILLDQTSASIVDLLTLNDYDLHAVLLSLNTKFNNTAQ